MLVHQWDEILQSYTRGLAAAAAAAGGALRLKSEPHVGHCTDSRPWDRSTRTSAESPMGVMHQTV